MAINFHIPGFTHHFNTNMMLLGLMERHPEAFYDNIRIDSMYGEFPPSLWNGGRTIGEIFPVEEMKKIIFELNSRGVSLRYTYTNPLINPSHLDDRHCNNCLKIADREDGMNAVIVVSDVLEKYIRKNYPNYRIVSSTCKQIRDFDQLCEELEKDYTLVVLDYNWNNNWEMLEKLPHKDRVEILVNAVCEPNCPRRGDHYKFLGRTQIGYVEHLQKEGPYKPYKLQEQFDCPHMGRMIYDITHHCTHVTPQDIYEKYVPMGFTNFKIEGRSSLAINVVETYLYYMVKPEHRDRMRMYFLLSMNQSGIIEFKD
ncbi:MAG: hypothetical protein IKL87_08255 [Oscillospiraceae bacterium]|nr:hypothetical protein [Oscillospiraceae bacterium]